MNLKCYHILISILFQKLECTLYVKKTNPFVSLKLRKHCTKDNSIKKKKNHQDQISFVTRHFIQTWNPFILDCYVSVYYIIACLKLVRLFFKRYYLNDDTNYKYNHCKPQHIYQVNQKVFWPTLYKANVHHAIMY